jgi:type II secretory pathway pseudopilin PulG
MLRRPPNHRSATTTAFSLLEILVAMAVLALMMAFMFNFAAQALRGWDVGMRQIEAAQAARVALDRMAQELQFAVAAAVRPPSDNNNSLLNIIPFYATDRASTVPGEQPGNLAAAPNSAQIFAVAPIANPLAAHGPFAEVGYFCAYNPRNQSYARMAPRTYYLIWHSPYGESEPKHDIYFRGAVTEAWLNDPISLLGNRMPLIDNCYQMKVRFAINDNSGRLTFTDRWTDRVRLPAGILVTLFVMDTKTAARIRQMQPQGLTPNDLEPTSTSDVARVLREGSIEMSRFIPFLNSGS